MPPYFVPDLVKAARNQASTSGIAVCHFDTLETVQVPPAASRVAFRAQTTMGHFSVVRSTLGEHNPDELSNFFRRVTWHNRHLSKLIITLVRVDTATVYKFLEDNMRSMKAKTKKRKAGSAVETTDAGVFVAPIDKGILFAETKPRVSEGQGYEPMGYNQRFFDIQDAQRVLPVHPLPTVVGLRFEVPPFGITTPVVYSAPAPNPLLVPLLCPLPWVGHSEALVLGSKVSAPVENRDPKLLQAACHLVLQGVVSEERLGQLKAEYKARPWDEWTPIFNHTFPSPDRPKDTGDRRVPQAAMVADDDDITTHDLLKLISTGKLLCKELDRMYPWQSHKVLVAEYLGISGHTRQHVHRDMRQVPLDNRTLFVFGAIERDVTQVDGSESYFIAESTHGFPWPWHAVPIHLHKGNALVLPSNAVHAHGCVPFDQPKDSHQTTFFFGMSSSDVTYRFTCGVAIPFWATQSTSPKEQHGWVSSQDCPWAVSFLWLESPL